MVNRLLVFALNLYCGLRTIYRRLLCRSEQYCAAQTGHNYTIWQQISAIGRKKMQKQCGKWQHKQEHDKQRQSAAFKVTHFKSTQYIVHSNKQNWTRLSKSVSWIHNTQNSIANSKWVTLNAARCYSPHGTTLNQHPTCSIPLTSSLSVWWHSMALQFTGPYCNRLFYGNIWKLKFLLTTSLTLTH
jgi:hypothetical protein